ncbi:MAG TPA: ABC transporter ATP-binding protein [Kofleriaceae bacterium]|nr:ABC transporter ATP-binding protein [Kofleriaceae bacterium]
MPEVTPQSEPQVRTSAQAEDGPRVLAKAGRSTELGASGPELTAIVTARAVGKQFGSVVALAGVDAEVPVDARVVGVLGPNGAGKSTLVKCLLGIIPFDGEARVLGLDPRRDGPAIRARVGYMPEGEVTLHGLSAVELCTYAAELSGLPRTEALQRAHAALYYAGLEDKRYQAVEGYSTGMKQRVKLAAALVHDPDLLFLDEPTNGLDPRAREEMLELIAELPAKRRCTIMLSTHLLTDVDRVCDLTLIMNKGLVRFSGTIEELRARGVSGDDVVVEVKDGADRLRAALVAEGLEAEAMTPVALKVTLGRGGQPRRVLAIARTVGVQVRTIEPHRDSMEQAFLRVVRDEATKRLGGPAPEGGAYREAAP